MSEKGASDAEKQQFVELQGKYVEATNRIKQLQMQSRGRESDKRRAELVIEELANIPEETRMFKALGKAFTLEPKADLMQTMESMVKSCDEDQAKYKTSAEYLQKQAAALETELKELLQSSEGLAREIAGMAR